MPRKALAGAITLLMVAAFLALSPVARAAAPSSGTIDSPDDELQWTGGPFPATFSEGNTGVSTNDAPPACPNDPASNCDVYKLDLAPSSPVAVTVTIDAAPTEDFDLYVFGPDGEEVGYSASANGLQEVVEIPAGATGRHEIRVKPFTTTEGATYDGAAVAEARVVVEPSPVPNDEADPVAGGDPFTKAIGFANKTGSRGIFTWQANRQVLGQVRLGTAPDALTIAGGAPTSPDTAGLSIVDGLTPGTKYYWKVVDTVTGKESGVGSFYAANAYNDWDGDVYTIDLLVQLDSDSAPQNVDPDQSLEDIAAGVNVMAERLYDALDGKARVGDVIVTDTNLDYAANVPFGPQHSIVPTSGVTPCAPGTNLSDVLVQTTVPFDSHTFSGFAINQPCTNFYVGRIGQLVTPWESDLHFGYVSTHELSHYAFNAPDLYDPAGAGGEETPNCNNPDWDGSLMHNTGSWTGGRWRLTELDRNAAQTPCDMGEPSEPFSWDALRERYTRVPASGPIDHMVDVLPRGNEDGGALRINILDRSPGASTLTPYAVDDTNTEVLTTVCVAGGPVVLDATGDAPSAVLGGPSDSKLDLLEVQASNAKPTESVVVTTKLLDLRPATTPPTNGSAGEAYDIGFTLAGKSYYLRARHRFGTADAFSLVAKADAAAGTSDTTVEPSLPGEFDVANKLIRVSIPLDVLSRLAGAPASGQVLTAWTATAWRDQGAVLLRVDDAVGSCDFTAGSTTPTSSTGGGTTTPPTSGGSAGTTGGGTGGGTGSGGGGSGSGAGASGAASKAPGYALLGQDGGIFTFGGAQFFGSTGDQKLNQPVVGMAWTPTGKGYWVVARDGGIFTFGDAEFFGSTGGMTLNQPILGMESSPTGRGYWLVASDGGIFTFGDAGFFGSTGDRKLNAPVVGLGTTTSGKGYWLVASDGGIFTFGDADFFGSTGDQKLNEPVFDLGATAGDDGYWLVARDGGVFTFGDATFHGSSASRGNPPVIGLDATGTDKGYWIANRGGVVSAFGDASHLGDLSGQRLNAPLVGFAATPS